MLKDKYLPGWLGPKKPNAEGTDGSQMRGEHSPGSPCARARGEAHGNPREQMERQVPESSRAPSMTPAGARQRAVGAGQGRWLSWLPRFPEQMQTRVSQAPEGNWQGPSEATAFILPLRALGTGY